MARRIRITADDFGWTKAHNRAVERAVQAGTLSHASLLCNGHAVAHASEVARRNPQLGVGVHLTLCEGRPLSRSSALTGLVAPSDDFHDSLRPLVLGYLQRTLPLAAIEDEWRRQIEQTRSLGVTPSHLDGHKHVHLLPPLLELTCRLAREYEVPFVRTPLESPSVRVLKRLPGWLVLSGLAISAKRLIRRYGLSTADHFIGFSTSGGMTKDQLLLAIRSAPPGVTEIMVHPAEEAPELDPLTQRYEWARSYRFAAEVDALCSPQVAEALQEQRPGARSQRKDCA
jgi:predicted glycoside hydrolase/deacetylase ChbG (UPF0249 family)